MKKKLILMLAAIALTMPAAGCGGNTTLEEDATGTGPVSVNPVNAIDKAEQAKDIENQAREQREQQMQNEMEGADL
jgi:hypothetical protein